jgi:WD40 repeat protein
MKAAWMVLMLGTQVLEDAASIHEAGITDGSVLTIAPKYKLLVRTCQGNIDLLSQEGMCEATILAGPNDVFEAVFSPDNTLIATMDAVSVELWRVYAGVCLFAFSGHGPRISVAFIPTGTMLMIVAQTNEAKLWCTSSGECIRALQVSRLGRIITAFTTDAALVLHMYDGRIALWNMRTASRVWEYPLNCQLYGPCSAGFPSCGDWFFTISDTGKVPTNGVDVWHVAG